MITACCDCFLFKAEGKEEILYLQSVGKCWNNEQHQNVSLDSDANFATCHVYSSEPEARAVKHISRETDLLIESSLSSFI